ncbi:N-acetylneuraminate synthase [Pseudoalteromonas simplex]|uniref:N-acetylneuraminate synthase n=1 Tax=Pseudoalteromonas simplex TaxID=2783613 RepID=UPI00188776C3|nr:N-acetylneuraminate synthase [Pseudoalteromonas sp. A520]
MCKTLIIAEAGVNHNGDINIAKKLIDVASDAGADFVKFQTFKASKLASVHAEKAEYQSVATGIDGTQLEMLKKLELSHESHEVLIDYCHHRNIGFLSTAFDLESLKFLCSKLQSEYLKVPSGEITNAPLLVAHARTGKKIILSTGMASLGDIEDALGALAFGFINDVGNPKIDIIKEYYSKAMMTGLLKDKVILLHCTTEYPAPFNEINLTAMNNLGSIFGLPFGYSDHSEGIVVPIAAAAKEAVVIEKHFTLDKNMEGPDHKASLDPIELKQMINAIRHVELSLGVGQKFAVNSEIKNKNIARKSLVASKAINKGDIFTENNLTAKRPGYGKSPMLYWDYIGTIATKSYSEDEII